ncbi:MAG: ubiquinol oxidase subunit II [Burkholderiaceae bacterium]|nr:ubiquinol oxidase subunit II [Burkholderiaceae bacterium]
MPSKSLLRGFALFSFATLLTGCNAIVMSPSGYVAQQQSDLIVIATVLMLLIIVPVIFLVFLFAWKYRKSANARYEPDWDHSTLLELLIWAAPLLIIIALGAVTWTSTHLLDPYRPLDRIDAQREVSADTKPLVVEVVALDWKWLFIYPEQGIATVNEMAAPIDRPIQFKLTASSVMNSFYVPAMAGQIYAMAGMQTTLHGVVNHPGVYDGFSANYSGAGFSHMRFKFHALDNAGFTKWVNDSRAAGETLSREAYLQLEQPSERVAVRRFSAVAPNLFDLVVNRCVEEGRMCMGEMMAIDAAGGLGVPGIRNITRLDPLVRERLGLTHADTPYVASMCSESEFGVVAAPVQQSIPLTRSAPVTQSSPLTQLSPVTQAGSVTQL